MAPTIGNVINLMEAAVEEAGSQRTQPTTINPTEVPEETQPQHSGTTAEEQGAAETTMLSASVLVPLVVSAAP